MFEKQSARTPYGSALSILELIDRKSVV